MKGAVGLIAGREITSRLQQRGYRIGFGIGLLVIVIVCVLPSFFSSDDNSAKASYDVGVTSGYPQLSQALQSASGAKFTVHAASQQQAERKVRDGDWDAAVLPGDTLVVPKTSSAVVAALQDVNRSLKTVDSLQQAGLGKAQVRRALDVTPLAVRATEGNDDTQRQTIAIISVVVLFSQLVTFCTWVATGVVEEKASRVVELILSSVRPLQLLAGKLLGIGVLAAAQVAALGIVALVAASVAGTLSVPASAVAVVVVSFVGFVLGFLFFAALAAALGSTVSRQEEVSGILAPVTLSLTVCYGLAFATGTNPDSTVARVFSILPPISALSMPARIAHGGVPLLDVVLAVAFLLVAAAAILAVAARVYRASVLHSGTRVPLRRAWRGEAVADIA